MELSEPDQEQGWGWEEQGATVSFQIPVSTALALLLRLSSFFLNSIDRTCFFKV